MRTAAIAFSFVLISGSPVDARHFRHQAKQVELRAGPLKVSPAAINSAKLAEGATLEQLSSPLMVKLQILLDRAHFSPGEISGRISENAVKAFEAFERENGFSGDHRITPDEWEKLADLGQASGSALEATSLVKEATGSRRAGGQERRSAREAADKAADAAVIQVSVTAEDTEGPFVQKIPKGLQDQAGLEGLSYTSVDEELEERYHASAKLLHALNPGVRFDQAGQQIWVPNIHSRPLESQVTKIVADKRQKTVTAYDRDNRLIAEYPATIGSQEKPSTSGRTEVARVVRDPWYTYDPSRLHFKGVKAGGVIKIAPGPKNPVGLVWIALTEGEGYGIHGSPAPDAIGKTFSHGCIRLTNWDALELASMVKRGTRVELTSEREESAANEAGKFRGSSRRTAFKRDRR
jgi:lipoprotein-anchoring transpeptidase ErfK/SrfK